MKFVKNLSVNTYKLVTSEPNNKAVKVHPNTQS